MLYYVFISALISATVLMCRVESAVSVETAKAFELVCQSAAVQDCMLDLEEELVTKYQGHPFWSVLKETPYLFSKSLRKRENSSEIESNLCSFSSKSQTANFSGNMPEKKSFFSQSIQWASGAGAQWAGYVLTFTAKVNMPIMKFKKRRNCNASMRGESFECHLDSDEEEEEEEEEFPTRTICLALRLSLDGDATIKLFDHERCIFSRDLQLDFNAFELE